MPQTKRGKNTWAYLMISCGIEVASSLVSESDIILGFLVICSLSTRWETIYSVFFAQKLRRIGTNLVCLRAYNAFLLMSWHKLRIFFNSCGGREKNKMFFWYVMCICSFLLSLVGYKNAWLWTWKGLEPSYGLIRIHGWRFEHHQWFVFIILQGGILHTLAHDLADIYSTYFYPIQMWTSLILFVSCYFLRICYRVSCIVGISWTLSAEYMS